jgi:hypothetical protein
LLFFQSEVHANNTRHGVTQNQSIFLGFDEDSFPKLSKILTL